MEAFERFEPLSWPPARAESCLQSQSRRRLLLAHVFQHDVVVGDHLDMGVHLLDLHRYRHRGSLGGEVVIHVHRVFARDDAATAYSFASPALQNHFRNPDGFMSMVRNGYAPVYRHRSFVFGEVKVLEGKIYQDVQIIDADGAAWDALYTLETQADGNLKISACILKKAVIS